eukprot:TRINITY_DN5448_c0_g1_i1.p1 TRINITY_DN5448_c0_g1~~TRINITY_DN5448_c0_g1_i1.p1  ORF type:complete len:612 (+),score=99.47 TRINITY_DN5448_c0_g1_i1:153-1838(+)
MSSSFSSSTLSSSPSINPSSSWKSHRIVPLEDGGCGYGNGDGDDGASSPSPSEHHARRPTLSLSRSFTSGDEWVSSLPSHVTTKSQQQPQQQPQQQDKSNRPTRLTHDGASTSRVGRITRRFATLTRATEHRPAHLVYNETNYSEEERQRRLSATLKIQAYTKGHQIRKIYRLEMQRRALVRDLISSEQEYIHDMAYMFEEYRSNMNTILPPGQVNILFHKMDDVLKCARYLLESLQMRYNTMHFLSGVSDAFLEDRVINDFVIEYSQQCRHEATAQYVLEALSRDPTVNGMLQQIQSRSRKSSTSSGYDLKSCLRMPMRRIRYYLDILRKMSFLTFAMGHVASAETSGLDGARQRLVDVVEAIKERGTDIDYTYPVDAINQLLEPSIKGLVVPHRRFIRQQTHNIMCEMASSSSSSSSSSTSSTSACAIGKTACTTFLFSDCLLVAERHTDLNKWKYKSRWVIPLKSARVLSLTHTKKKARNINSIILQALDIDNIFQEDIEVYMDEYSPSSSLSFSSSSSSSCCCFLLQSVLGKIVFYLNTLGEMVSWKDDIQDRIKEL